MISFENDYNKGAHPKLIEALAKTNLNAVSGYGNDKYCESAKEKIRAAIGMDDSEIFFLVGGTQTNTVVIDALTKSYEGVIAATTGHINVHESGAIEGSGHKVIPLPGKDGKIVPEILFNYLETFYADPSYEHMAMPGMVYISFPTEVGTLYSKAELQQIHDICLKYKIPLFIDGARLGYGLMSDECDVSVHELAELCEVFYIGGTKVGALIGEAVVFTKHNMPRHFVTTVKRHGALLAKGRVLGVQFDALFTDDLYYNISRHAMECAKKLKNIFTDAGFRMFIDSPTNQQFIICPNEIMIKLSEKVVFSFWEKYDKDNSVIRFVTGWGTTEEELEELKDIIANIR